VIEWNQTVTSMANTFWDISKLHEWDKNPRSISKDGFERLKKQIKKLGQYKPLLITTDGTVLGGNMRLRAYKELGVDKVWVSIINPKTENEKLEYSLSDNDRAGYYDDDLLTNLSPYYPDFNWSDYAVDLKEPTNLDELLDQFKEVVEDEVPEVSDEPAISKLGEVYQLGRHRLMCGDSTKIEDVEKLMDGKKADMVFTDPPYGMNLNTKNSARKTTSAFAKAKGVSSGRDYDAVIGDDKEYDPIHLFKMFPDVKEMFLWGGDYYSDLIPNKKDSSWFVWDKRIEENFDNMIGSSFEMCWSKQKHKREIIRIRWVFIFGTEKEFDKKRHHPTQKPIELSVWFINKFSKENNLIIDLFGGSGSTLIACEQTNRICYMMELDPKYCDVIRKRYANLIGKGDSWQTETPVIL